MSGPKISVYQLSAQARRIVTEQVRCERDALACAEDIESLLKTVLSCGTELEQMLSRYELLKSRQIEIQADTLQLKNLLAQIEKESAEIRLFLNANMPHLSEKYRVSEEDLNKKRAALSKLKAKKQQAQKILNDATSALEKCTAQVDSQAEQINDSIARDLASNCSFEDLSACSEPDKTPEETKANLGRKLQSLLYDKSLPESSRVDILNAFNLLGRLSSSEELRNFEAVTMTELAQSIAKHKATHEQALQDFSEAMSRYQTLCRMVGISARAFRFEPSAVETLRAETAQLEAVILKQHEQAYISECVNQVMQDMGYDLIGTRDVKKRSGKQFRNELFTFREGTAVNVTYSPDGQIAMELGGLSRQDRLPSPEETVALTDDMETFCGEFAEFEKRLYEKGIVLGSRLAMSPPTAEYATMINISDYTTAESTQISELGTSKRHGTKAEKQVLRRDNEWH